MGRLVLIFPCVCSVTQEMANHVRQVMHFIWVKYHITSDLFNPGILSYMINEEKRVEKNTVQRKFFGSHLKFCFSRVVNYFDPRLKLNENFGTLILKFF